VEVEELRSLGVEELVQFRSLGVAEFRSWEFGSWRVGQFYVKPCAY
jgi:hypothetical protein